MSLLIKPHTCIEEFNVKNFQLNKNCMMDKSSGCDGSCSKLLAYNISVCHAVTEVCGEQPS